MQHHRIEAQSSIYPKLPLWYICCAACLGGPLYQWYMHCTAHSGGVEGQLSLISAVTLYFPVLVFSFSCHILIISLLSCFVLPVELDYLEIDKLWIYLWPL